MKTLKDFPTLKYSSGLVVYKEELRNEAIKWIKDLKQQKGDSDDSLWAFSGYDETGEHYEVIIKWIKHFFNITEENPLDSIKDK